MIFRLECIHHTRGHMFHYFVVVLDRHKREGNVHNWAYMLARESNVTVSIKIQPYELNEQSRPVTCRETPCPPLSTSCPPISPVRRSTACTPIESCLR